MRDRQVARLRECFTLRKQITIRERYFIHDKSVTDTLINNIDSNFS